LTEYEQSELTRLEAIIETHLIAKQSAGEALLKIRDERLYRGTHATFEAYVRERWRIERRYALYLVEGARAVNVIESANVHHGAHGDPPAAPQVSPRDASERAIRNLSAVPDAQKADVWRRSVELAGGNVPTSRHTAAAVDELKPPPALPRAVEGGYGTIEIDPPWPYDDKGGRAAFPYRSMTVEQIRALAPEIDRLASPNAHLWLWVVDAHLELACQLVRESGFEVVSTIVWVKAGGGEDANGNPTLHIGAGHYVRHAHELCILARRGETVPEIRDVPSVFFAPRREHSRKPANVQIMAERISPPPRLEMFARRSRDGWVGWGDQAPAPESAVREPGEDDVVVPAAPSAPATPVADTAPKRRAAKAKTGARSYTPGLPLSKRQAKKENAKRASKVQDKLRARAAGATTEGER
jgi:N6-adenosine-specific RNA methylase IME4